MNAIEMREKLHSFIESVEDKRMKIIYSLFENEINTQTWEYTDQYKKELESRYRFFIDGGKMIPSADAAKQTQELLKKIRG